MEFESLKNLGEGFVTDHSGFYDKNRDFTSLNSWKCVRKVKLFFCNKLIPRLPKEEKYKLGGQIRDVSVSNTANIAEGYGRFHYQDGIQFYRISRASTYELKGHLITCLDLRFVDRSFNEGISLIE